MFESPFLTHVKRYALLIMISDEGGYEVCKLDFLEADNLMIVIDSLREKRSCYIIAW